MLAYPRAASLNPSPYTPSSVSMQKRKYWRSLALVGIESLPLLSSPSALVGVSSTIASRPSLRNRNATSCARPSSTLRGSGSLYGKFGCNFIHACVASWASMLAVRSDGRPLRQSTAVTSTSPVPCLPRRPPLRCSLKHSPRVIRVLPAWFDPGCFDIFSFSASWPTIRTGMSLSCLLVTPPGALASLVMRPSGPSKKSRTLSQRGLASSFVVTTVRQQARQTHRPLSLISMNRLAGARGSKRWHPAQRRMSPMHSSLIVVRCVSDSSVTLVLLLLDEDWTWRGHILSVSKKGCFKNSTLVDLFPALDFDTMGRGSSQTTQTHPKCSL
mmetsp:Transcript_1/g.4  ORF Transcript_1/g.4 Transcript_1/m.4 type:complete len:328 (-) Transcript_1:645-1628(-)